MFRAAVKIGHRRGTPNRLGTNCRTGIQARDGGSLTKLHDAQVVAYFPAFPPTQAKLTMRSGRKTGERKSLTF